VTISWPAAVATIVSRLGAFANSSLYRITPSVSRAASRPSGESRSNLTVSYSGWLGR
jgi:hypothetical protein